MHFLNEYIQPLINWLHNNPHWALLITFLISFSESLAIIGSIVPGSVTMTAIGILAGSGVIRVDMTLLAATLGAVFGDSASYFLGYYYSDKLSSMWPFKKYPHWLEQGKKYFSQHGGKSVLIGRFIGPLRAMIPVIAGMMHMSQWRFLTANIISAIGWSLLYVTPGILIGAASSELSPEIAGKLFVYILILIFLLWILAQLIKWLFIKTNHLLSVNLHEFWVWSKKHPKLSHLFLSLTPEDEENHYPTAALAIGFLLSLILLFILFLVNYKADCISYLNQPIHYFMLSLRLVTLDNFFLLINQFQSTIALSVTIAVMISYFLFIKRFRLAIYLIFVVISVLFIAKVMAFLCQCDRPEGLLTPLLGFSFPHINLSLETAVFIFYVLFLNRSITGHLLQFSKFFIFIILLLTGASSVYLGEHWLMDILGAYTLGLSTALLFWIVYRRRRKTQNCGLLSVLILVLPLSLTAGVEFFINYQNIRFSHQLYKKQYMLTEEQWWNRNSTPDSYYRLSRLGEISSILNIQYLGSLNVLKKQLLSQGWVVPDSSFFSSIIQHMNRSTRKKALPVFYQLHNNRRPVLLLSFQHKQQRYVLRLWESNISIDEMDEPLYVGTVSVNGAKLKRPSYNTYGDQGIKFLLSDLENFKTKKIQLLKNQIKKTLHTNGNHILLIKASQQMDSKT